MLLSDLANKNIALWGMGREGETTLAFLKNQFPHKKFILINDKPLQGFDQERYIDEENLLNHLDDIDVVIKSPGISYYHDAVKIMQERGIIITSATNIWFSIPKQGKVIAITGSNGKSTTSALLHHILVSLGHNALLGGNIGTPLLSLANDSNYYIVELSSYQTCDLKYAPDIAVLLNLFPEHIQWHKNHDTYYKDKCNLLRRGSPFNIVNFNEPRTANIAANSIFFNDVKAIHYGNETILDGNDVIGSTVGHPLLGDHNLENICAALSVCKILDLNLAECLKASFNYPGLAHRLQMVGKFGKFHYVNDSISTDPEATIAGLKALKDKNITLIAGGQDREQDYSELCKFIEGHDNISVICIYQTGSRLLDQLQSAHKQKAASLAEAMSIAQNITPEDGYILLSPAAPSYDVFKNFEERGDLFIKLAKA